MKKTEKAKLFRQGDVMLQVVPAESVPADAKAVPRESGRVVLAHGEVTGHSHAIASTFAHLVAKGADRFLRVTRPVRLLHEEHDEIRLPAANYRVTIQREYEPGEIRNVAD